MTTNHQGDQYKYYPSTHYSEHINIDTDITNIISSATFDSSSFVIFLFIFLLHLYFYPIFYSFLSLYTIILVSLHC